MSSKSRESAAQAAARQRWNPDSAADDPVAAKPSEQPAEQIVPSFYFPARLSDSEREALALTVPYFEPSRPAPPRPKHAGPPPQFIRIIRPSPGLDGLFLGVRTVPLGAIIRVDRVSRRRDERNRVFGPPGWWAEHLVDSERAVRLIDAGSAEAHDGPATYQLRGQGSPFQREHEARVNEQFSGPGASPYRSDAVVFGDDGFKRPAGGDEAYRSFLRMELIAS